MKKKKAIEIFNKWMDCKDAFQADPSCDGNCLSCEYYASAEEEKEAMSLAISALEKQEQDRWIPVTERLPEEDDYRPCYGYEDGVVWWRNDAGLMGLGWYYTSTKNWAFYDEITHVEGIVGNVIAWRPLPEAYTIRRKKYDQP